MDAHFLSQIPSWIVTAIIGLIGIGIGWGFVKSEIHHIKEKQVKHEEKVNLIVGRDYCQKYRDECREAIKDQIDEVKLAVETNRNIVLSKFDEIMQFMGYVKGKIEDYNGRLK